MTFKYWTNYYRLEIGDYWRHYFTSLRVSNYTYELHDVGDNGDGTVEVYITTPQDGQLLAIV